MFIYTGWYITRWIFIIFNNFYEKKKNYMSLHFASFNWWRDLTEILSIYWGLNQDKKKESW